MQRADSSRKDGGLESCMYHNENTIDKEGNGYNLIKSTSLEELRTLFLVSTRLEIQYAMKFYSVIMCQYLKKGGEKVDCRQ